jgi:hypothetical protein
LQPNQTKPRVAHENQGQPPFSHPSVYEGTIKTTEAVSHLRFLEEKFFQPGNLSKAVKLSSGLTDLH